MNDSLVAFCILVLVDFASAAEAYYAAREEASRSKFELHQKMHEVAVQMLFEQVIREQVINDP